MKYFSTLLVIALTLTIRSDKALAQSQSISAGFRGTHGTDGNMFEIAAKDQPVLIERLDINMGEGTEPVEVYYRPGHVNYTYDDSYKLIFGGNITSAGRGLATPLPPFTSPVLVTPGTSVTFYVTIANRYGANLWYSIGVGSGTTYASDENIDIIEGYASGYPWTGNVAYDRQWNGVVYYTALAQSVSAGFRGTHGTDGNMFEIAAKVQPVLIERLDINMGEGTEPVEVYYRPGHVNYTYDDSYKLIFGGNITSAGRGLATPLPPFTSPVLVTPGTSVTFYVTIANRYGANMWYSIGVGSGTTYASDENIDIIEGYASGYPWTGNVAYDRQWNGVVYYSLQTNSSPTASPTKRPTASPVISFPSIGNLNPTASPVATQTVSPTIIEVDDDEVITKSPTPTMSSALLTSVPTLSPTVDDDDDFWPFPLLLHHSTGSISWD